MTTHMAASLNDLAHSSGCAPGSRKVPLLHSHSQTKPKDEPKTYVFELELGESNDLTYPEFSWAELVRKEKVEELAAKKAEGGKCGLDPYASDDEDDLKAMAAKFEEKYGNGSPIGRKKKRRVEDFIDRGAGYDETDPFIDNTDAYDELVPQDMNTVYGGFYINSGQLDFKEEQLSEDDEAEDSASRARVLKFNNELQKKKTAASKSAVLDQKVKVASVTEPAKKKRKVSTETAVKRPPKAAPTSKNGQSVKNIISKVKKVDNEVTTPEPGTNTNKNDGTKKRPLVIKSSSSSSTSSSSSDSSSSDSDDSSSSSENEGAKPTTAVKDDTVQTIEGGVKSKFKKPTVAKIISRMDSISPLNMVPVKKTMQPANPAPIRKLKTKNVPLNPNLHRPPDSTLSITKAPVAAATITPKMMKAVLPRKVTNPKIQSQSAKTPPSGSPSTSFIRIPTPTQKPDSTPTSSPAGLSFNSPSPSSSFSPSGDLMMGQNKPNLKPKPSFYSKTLTQAGTSGGLGQELMNSLSLANFSSSVNKAHKLKPQGRPRKVNAIASTNTNANVPVSKPLPKLKHKSGLTFDSQSQTLSPSSSKSAKLKSKYLANELTDAAAVFQQCQQQYNLAAYSNYLQGSLGSSGGGVEITKLQTTNVSSPSSTATSSTAVKPMPGIGSGITVTEVNNKMRSPGGLNYSPNSTASNAAATVASLLGYANTATLFPGLSQAAMTSVASSSMTNSNSKMNTSGASNSNPRLPQSITITPTPVSSTASGSLAGLGSGNRLPGYITPFDVNALLGGSSNAPSGNSEATKSQMQKYFKEAQSRQVGKR